MGNRFFGRSVLYGAILATTACVPVAAMAMTVEAFLAEAKALPAKGARATRAPNFSTIRAEIKAAAQSYRDQVEADRVAGRPPRSCPPPLGKARIDARALVADLEAIPLARRSQDVATAFAAIMQRRYPCG